VAARTAVEAILRSVALLSLNGIATIARQSAWATALILVNIRLCLALRLINL
jgi:hypothetical protein